MQQVIFQECLLSAGKYGQEPIKPTLNVISRDNKILNPLIIILSKYSTFLTEKIKLIIII